MKKADTGAESRRRGGQACLQKYGAEHYQDMGRKGGDRTKQRYGADYYRRIGEKGREARRKKKVERQALSFSPMSGAIDEKERRNEEGAVEENS